MLRLYLGAAPGAGKTYAMLSEGLRRQSRGCDVLVAAVQTHGRAHTEQLARGLPAISTVAGDLDVAGLLTRRPALVLVDEYAHRNSAGTPNAHRWQDVEELLAAGLDVVSTLNVDELEGMADVVERITGTKPASLVPEWVARRAAEVTFVDETPEALRRRMAHGNIYPAERVDAALADYFRPGNLAALRELALLWVADRVEEGLQRYRADQKIEDPWQTRQRITVALSGSEHGTALIRRAVRLSGRAGAQLFGVHVVTPRGSGAQAGRLAEQRALVESLGGSYHLVRGADPATALVDFAGGVNASELVLGSGRRSRWSDWTPAPGVAVRTVRLSGTISVHLVNPDADNGRGAQGSLRLLVPSARRALLGSALSLMLLLATTLALTAARQHLNLLSAVLVYLLATVLVALTAGLLIAALTAVAATVLLNYYFTPPLHRFTINEGNNALALLVFVVVSLVVAILIERAERQRLAAARASSEAETLATVAGSVLRGESALPELMEQVREIFGMRAIALLERDGAGWRVAAAIGSAAPASPEEADVVVPADESFTLVLSGSISGGDDQRVLRAFAIQAAAALRTERLAAEAERSRPLLEVDRTRTALLAAVSHDLRTPLAGAKAAVSSLRDPSVSFTAEDRAELLATAEESLDRLAKLVANLLDMSRLQAGAMAVHCQVIAVEDVVARALDSLGKDGDRVSVAVAADVPPVSADPGLLERVIGNLLENALRVSPAGRPPLARVSAHHARVELRIIDAGPGLADEAKHRAFLPFQRLGDTSNTTGVGLGLALARGLTEAMGGVLTPEDTPGGGLTMVLSLTAAADYVGRRHE
jgi:two-component system, OmpR family, sensor histidine kinase KdpD